MVHAKGRSMRREGPSHSSPSLHSKVLPMDSPYYELSFVLWTLGVSLYHYSATPWRREANLRPHRPYIFVTSLPCAHLNGSNSIFHTCFSSLMKSVLSHIRALCLSCMARIRRRVYRVAHGHQYPRRAADRSSRRAGLSGRCDGAGSDLRRTCESICAELASRSARGRANVCACKENRRMQGESTHGTGDSHILRMQAVYALYG
ncbi:hypothetical protein BD626DRAFT_229852 [Schizophyllum amplum]|uniref:Uncharacterized protein n=1 Tax=Schizophyllum amplum TaxID=97359 RepID=A0A550BWG0_9AGAR|nr:hypothetical protein BD626DRAFT_229852 [Auriculariopsis ampla]